LRVSKNESGVCASVQLMKESEIEGYIYTFIEIIAMRFLRGNLGLV